MKRIYEKPEIMFESFALNTSISAGCEGINSSPTAGECAIVGTGEGSGIAMFNGLIAACIFKIEDAGQSTDEYDGLCYDVFNGAGNWFNSL